MLLLPASGGGYEAKSRKKRVSHSLPLIASLTSIRMQHCIWRDVRGIRSYGKIRVP